MLRAIFGLAPVRRGLVRLAAVIGPASPAERLAQGVGMLSEDRQGEGLALSLSLADNLTLSDLKRYRRGGWLRRGEQARAAAGWIERLGIRAAGSGAPAGSLSGGNQQKLALARLLHHDCDVLLLDEPTRGIDVSSKAQIYELIGKLAQAGKAVLFVSSYLPELLGVCDTIAVMCRGRLGGQRETSEWSEHSLLLAAAGGAA
jgi:ribose transport system ATP-binding protein